MSAIPVRKAPEPAPDRPRCQFVNLGFVCFDEAAFVTVHRGRRLPVCEAHYMCIHRLALWAHVAKESEAGQ